MYHTLEELQRKYPIGSTYKTYWNNIREWCPTEKDVILFKYNHPNIRNFKRYEDGIVSCEEKNEDIVEGYLFDGKYWYPAFQTWDGWLPMDEEK